MSKSNLSYLQGRQAGIAEAANTTAQARIAQLEADLAAARAAAAPPAPPAAPAPPPPPPAPPTLREQLAEIRKRSKPEAAVFALANAAGICAEYGAEKRGEK